MVVLSRVEIQACSVALGFAGIVNCLSSWIKQIEIGSEMWYTWVDIMCLARYIEFRKGWP